MKMTHWAFVLLLLSVNVFAETEMSVDPYIGYQQTALEAYGVEGDIYGGVVGFWMGDHAAIEIAYEETSDFNRCAFSLLGSVLHGYRQRLTWQIGADYVEADVLGLTATDSFYHYGLGYEFQPFHALTLRAQYNVYGMDEDNGTNNPNGVSFSALYNF